MCEASDRRRATARFTEIMEKEMISRIISSIRIFSNFSILGEEIFDARVLWRIKRYDTGCWIIGTGWRRDGLFLEERETVSSMV